MILVVGATGMVGSEICRQLGDRGTPVRALVRPSADPAKVHLLREHGADPIEGDLRDQGSLARACAGVDAVVTTVSAMPFSYEPGRNDFETTDRAGQLALIEAAKAAGVRHLVYLSFSGNLDRDFPLRNAKRTVEAALIASGIPYTILRPSCFMEVWLGPAVGFDYANAKATIYGDGTAPVGYIAVPDVAQFAVASLDSPVARNAILELGGPRSISQLDAVAIFERALGRPIARTHVPVEALDAQVAGATDPLQRSFAALMRCVADGDPVDMGPVIASMPVVLTSVEDFAARAAAAQPVTAS